MSGLKYLVDTNTFIFLLDTIQSLLDACVKVAHFEDINKLTISLKQQHKIKLPDALIAATAIFHSLPLLTFDKGFSQIKSMDLILLEL